MQSLFYRLKEWFKRERFWTKLAVAFSVIFAWVAMRTYDMFYIEPYATSYLMDECNLVGRWRFDSFFSERCFTEEDFKSLELIISENHTFRLYGIPNLMIIHYEGIINDSPLRYIDEINSSKRTWIVSHKCINEDDIIAGHWQIVEREEKGNTLRWLDLTAQGYNFDPWKITESGLFASGRPFNYYSRKGIMLRKERNNE